MSHAPALVEALAALPSALRLTSKKQLGETTTEGAEALTRVLDILERW